jgi:hypothetical protein
VISPSYHELFFGIFANSWRDLKIAAFVGVALLGGEKSERFSKLPRPQHGRFRPEVLVTTTPFANRIDLGPTIDNSTE